MMVGVGGTYDSPAGPASAVEDFLVAAGRQPAGLLIEGEAGIGKTTLWNGVVDRAEGAGFLVLSARTAQAESGLANAAVADLFEKIDSRVLAGLPDMQRLAADRVMLREPTGGRPTDERVTAAALLSAVHAMSAQAPVLIAIDDVQWLDPSSVAVLAFVARRLKGPIGVVVTERSGEDFGERAASWLQVGTAGVVRVRVPPMSLGALHTMLSARLGKRFSRPAIVRIAEVSGGNPLYALELARVVDDGPLGRGQRLPETLADVVRLRVAGLSDKVRDVLLVAASVNVPTVDLLAGVIGVGAAQITGMLEVAEVEGIVTIEGNRVRFTHPLLASGIYENAEPELRREFHRRLAQLYTQPELRARHLALATTEADEATLSTLDAAAESARTRGAPAAAAELVELAIELGGGEVSRRIRAAEHHFVAGDMQRTAVLLDGVIAELRPGVLRAVALNLLAAVRTFEDNYAAAVDLLEQARGDAEDDDAVLVASLVSLCFAQGMAGRFDEQISTGRRAVEIAERAGVSALTSQALALWVLVAARAGDGLDEEVMRRAVELQDPDVDVPIPFNARATCGFALGVAGRLAEADDQLTEVAERSRLRGAEHDVVAILGYRTLVAIWRGRYDEANAHATEMLSGAEQLGGSMVIASSFYAASAAYRGQEAQARRHVDRALAQGAVYSALTIWARTALAFLEVSLGDYEAAVQAVAPLIDVYRPFDGTELMSASFMPDAVEALIAVGRRSDAEELTDALERNGRHLDRPWMLAVGSRCRALVSVDQGDLDGAEQAALRAMTEHDRLPMPFERARSLLVLGEVRRRLRRRDAAVECVREALREFESLGAPLWVNRARQQLSGIAAARTETSELTDSERRVAELVASGMSNREVAEALFVSVKTVETNLTRVYRKLGIRSRAQLGKRLRQS